MTTTVRDSDGPAVIAILEQSIEIMEQTPGRHHHVVHLPDHGRLLIAGDLHDNTVHLRKATHAAGLEKSDDHHLIIQELIHGGHLVNGVDLSYRMLVRVASLIVQSPGRVHPILGNHELAQRFRRPISKGAGDATAQFLDGVEWVFPHDADDVLAAIDAFIDTMPIAVKCAAGVLCSHSLPAPRDMERFDPTVLDRALTREDYASPDGSVHLMTWGRGQSVEQVDALAKTWGVETFCVGHASVPSGIETRCGRMIVLNSDHQHGRVLPLDLANPIAPQEAVLHALPLASIAIES
jgi:hypothetical protein